MSGSESLYSDLIAFAGLQSLVANTDSPVTYRVYPYQMPQDSTLPAVVYQLIAGSRVLTVADDGGTGVERNVYQITAWGETLDDADSVIEQVRLALKDASRNYVPQSKRETFDPDTRLHGVEYDFSQWYR